MPVMSTSEATRLREAVAALPDGPTRDRYAALLRRLEPDGAVPDPAAAPEPAPVAEPQPVVHAAAPPVADTDETTDVTAPAAAEVDPDDEDTGTFEVPAPPRLAPHADDDPDAWVPKSWQRPEAATEEPPVEFSFPTGVPRPPDQSPRKKRRWGRS